MIVTRIGPDGVSGSMRPASGDEAILESDWVFTGATTFQESGSIVFGNGTDRLRFSTFGSAYLGPASDDGCRQGTAIRLVEGGEGRFAGARGLIASVFCLDAELSLVDHHLGMLLMP
jgi:hypothetical protein